MKYVYFKVSAIFPDAGADKVNAFISFPYSLNPLNGQIQDLRRVSQLFAQSLLLGRFLK